MARRANPTRPSQAVVDHVAANVRAELGRKKRTRRELAAALRVDEHRVSKRVRGLVPFSADEIVQVAAFLGVTVEDLVSRPTPDATAGAA